MNTNNLFEPPAPPAAAGNDGVEVQAFWGNNNDEGGGEPEAGDRPPPPHIFDNFEGEDLEAGVEGQDHGTGAVAANYPPYWHSWSWGKKSKYFVIAAASLGVVAAGTGIGAWQSKQYQSSAMIKTPKAKEPKMTKVPKSKSSKAPSSEPSLVPSEEPSFSPSCDPSREDGVSCDDAGDCCYNNCGKAVPVIVEDTCGSCLGKGNACLNDSWCCSNKCFKPAIGSLAEYCDGCIGEGNLCSRSAQCCDDLTCQRAGFVKKCKA